MQDAAVLPEDRDVAEERKRVLDCQPVLESMAGSPLILQELSKVGSVYSLRNVCVSVRLHMMVRTRILLGVHRRANCSGSGPTVSGCKERRVLWPPGL